MNTQEIIEAMKALTDEERLAIIRNFCEHCGRIQDEDDFRGCQCWNDE